MDMKQKMEEQNKLNEKGILTEEEIRANNEENIKEHVNNDEKVSSVVWWILGLTFIFLMIVCGNRIYTKEYTASNTKYTDTEYADVCADCSINEYNVYCVGFNSALMKLVGGIDASKTTALQGITYLRRIRQGLEGDKSLNFIARGVQAFQDVCASTNLKSETCQNIIKECLPISEKAQELFR